MKKRMTLMGLAALFLSGCAAPEFSSSPAASTAAPAPANLSLQGQSRLLRTKIVQLKQEVRVFEGMLTDVERRAAMAQVSVSSLPNTDDVPGASVASDTTPARRDADRLSVTVRPAPAARPAENMNGKVPQK